MRLQLAIEYEIEEKWDKALEHFKWLIDNPNTLQKFEMARCFSGVAKAYTYQGDVQKSHQYFREGRIYFPNFTDNYLDDAQLYYNHKEFKSASQLCEEALKNCKESYWCNVHDIKSYFVFYVAALSYFYQKDLAKSFSFICIAALLNPTEQILNLQKEIGNHYINSLMKGV